MICTVPFSLLILNIPQICLGLTSRQATTAFLNGHNCGVTKAIVHISELNRDWQVDLTKRQCVSFPSEVVLREYLERVCTPGRVCETNWHIWLSGIGVVI